MADEFASKSCIAIGWNEIGELSAAKTPADVRSAYLKAYPDAKPGEVGNAVAMLHKFRSTMKIGDRVVTYNRSTREYLIGDMRADYQYAPGVVTDHPHLRRVEWSGNLAGLAPCCLAQHVRQHSTLTLFSPPRQVSEDLSQALREEATPLSVGTAVEQASQEKVEIEESRQDTQARALELIKDKLSRLDDTQIEQLVAALLRAMGYRTRVSQRVPIAEWTSSRRPTDLVFKSRV